MIRCFCIDDSNRPVEIPEIKWPKKGNQYRITFIARCMPQNVLAFSLYELPLDESNAPYEYFQAYRFCIHMDDLNAFFQMCRDTHDLDDLDISELMKNYKLKVISGGA